MNNKTVIAVLVLVLVALTGVGVGKYAHNYSMKQEAASLRSQKVDTSVDGRIKVITPTQSGGTKGNTNLAGCVNYINGAAPAAGTLSVGAVVFGTFSIQNTCSYDISIQQITTVALQSNADIRLDVQDSNTYVYDNTGNTLAGLNTALSAFIGTFGQYVFESTSINVGAGQTHSFEVRGVVAGVPTPGMSITTQTTNIQAFAPSLGTAVPVNGVASASAQIFTF